MRIKEIFYFCFILLSVGTLAIGRLFDPRLEILGLNLSIIISVLFILSYFPLLLSIRSININSTKTSFYSFLGLVIISPLLWVVYDYVEYGIQKYINFVVLLVPLLVIITERFSYKQVKVLFSILIKFILVLSFIGLSIVGDSRLSVLGGGPIVFARWMIVGMIILFFLKKHRKLNWILIFLFFALSLAAGSRGPIFALFVTASLYVFLNFQKVILKLFATILLVFSIFNIVVPTDDLRDLGKTERLVTKDSTSKNIRLRFAKRSLEILSLHPLGVGLGNWQTYCNKEKPYHLLRHDYPHNLILEVFAELGFLGGVLLLLLILKVLYFTYFRMKNFANKDSFYPLLFYLQIFLVTTSCFSGSLNDARLLFVVFSISLIQEPLINLDDEA